MRKTICLASSITLTSFIPVLLCAVPETRPSIEVRFCPASAVRTYPLESRRELQSLVLQNMAVVNHDTSAFKIEGIELELLQSGQVLDSKKLDSGAIQHVADRGAKMQAAGVIQEVAFQFCGTELIAPSIKIAGPILEKNQALLVTSQVFAFSGARDVLRVRVHGKIADRATEVSGTLPIRSDFAKNTYIFPLRGVWFAGIGASLHTVHRWAIPEEFALDIAKLGGEGLTHRGGGTRFEEYYGYGADVLAAADGRILEAVNDQPEDVAAMQRPDESQELILRGSRRIRQNVWRKGQPASQAITSSLITARASIRFTRTCGRAVCACMSGIKSKPEMLSANSVPPEIQPSRISIFTSATKPIR